MTGPTKRFGEVTAVDGLSFEVPPGRVTGFLGPNGAGKSTTMHMIMGLERPSAGSALIKGVPYAELAAPLRQVGALLEARSFHPGRSARAHLGWLAASNGLPAHGVNEVLEITGLTDVASRRAGTFSLGMGSVSASRLRSSVIPKCSSSTSP
nr:ATP-binding cassette domain-containing protein [Acidimicrobium ferrooxidans]